MVFVELTSSAKGDPSAVASVTAAAADGCDVADALCCVSPGCDPSEPTSAGCSGRAGCAGTSAAGFTVCPASGELKLGSAATGGGGGASTGARGPGSCSGVSASMAAGCVGAGFTAGASTAAGGDGGCSGAGASTAAGGAGFCAGGCMTGAGGGAGGDGATAGATAARVTAGGACKHYGCRYTVEVGSMLTRQHRTACRPHSPVGTLVVDTAALTGRQQSGTGQSCNGYLLTRTAQLCLGRSQLLPQRLDNLGRRRRFSRAAA